MTACHSCAHFESTRMPGKYFDSCLDCQARRLANGPLYFASDKAGKPTEEYKAALIGVFGEDWKAGHQRVKRYAARIKGETA